MGVRSRPTRMSEGFAEAASKGGGIQPGAHPEFDDIHAAFKMPDLGAAVGKVLNWHRESDEQMQNDIAKAKGEGNYYRNSPSKTKGILGMRRAGK